MEAQSHRTPQLKLRHCTRVYLYPSSHGVSQNTAYKESLVQQKFTVYSTSAATQKNPVITAQVLQGATPLFTAPVLRSSSSPKSVNTGGRVDQTLQQLLQLASSSQENDQNNDVIYVSAACTNQVYGKIIVPFLTDLSCNNSF